MIFPTGSPSYFSTSPRTEQAIWRYLATRGEAKPTEPLFATTLGLPLDRTILRRLIHTTGERASVLDAHPHHFRHTFAITFLCNGRQRLLSWANTPIRQAALRCDCLSSARRW